DRLGGSGAMALDRRDWPRGHRLGNVGEEAWLGGRLVGGRSDARPWGGGGGVAPVRVGRAAGLLPVGVPLARSRSGRSGGLSRTAGRIVGAGPPARAACVCSSQTFTCSSPGESATALRSSGSAERLSPLLTRTSEMRW